MIATYETTMQSPMGWLKLRASGEGLTHLAFAEGPGAAKDDHAVLRQAATEMAEYVAGTRREFTVRLAPEEHTASRWLPWREAAQRCFSWSNRDAIRMLPERRTPK